MDIYFILTAILICVNIVSFANLTQKASEVNTTNPDLLQKIITTMGLLVISCITIIFYERTISGSAIHIGICYNAYLLARLLDRNTIHIK